MKKPLYIFPFFFLSFQVLAQGQEDEGMEEIADLLNKDDLKINVGSEYN